ncbi:hypothetical protein SKAU_G00164620 [Synaphobranchus kaupii]|uniref:Uncharacterized protein n=1 Tax=Synaphobranchus kaupii TaxID=118154 RepID=A0A9Q1FJP1_SYNKA|nr:hypothetical protein SKAU_G00164620 [Synaphobranchus kaupii]
MYWAIPVNGPITVATGRLHLRSEQMTPPTPEKMKTMLRQGQHSVVDRPHCDTHPPTAEWPLTRPHYGPDRHTVPRPCLVGTMAPVRHLQACPAPP